MKILVIGAGLSGATVANTLAEKGHFIDIIDRREHLAGNAYDFINSIGIRVHKYGPHLFHTSNMKVVKYLSQFTEWVDYKHKVKAMLSDGQLVTLPVNKETAKIVGEENIIDTFYRPYSRKMWDRELEDIDPKILQRVPVSKNLNELYFPNDKFQALPKNGYTSLVENMLSNKNINISLNKKFTHVMIEKYDHVFSSMSIDEFFAFQFGRLPYRSIKFHHFNHALPRFFPVATVNFTHEEKFTRVTEWKNLPNHGDKNNHTTLTFEEPCYDYENDYEQYYPIKDPTNFNRALYNKYAMKVPKSVTFIGRCGNYAYLDMHQAVNSALKVSQPF